MRSTPPIDLSKTPGFGAYTYKWCANRLNKRNLLKNGSPGRRYVAAWVGRQHTRPTSRLTPTNVGSDFFSSHVWCASSVRLIPRLSGSNETRFLGLSGDVPPASRGISPIQTRPVRTNLISPAKSRTTGNSISEGGHPCGGRGIKI